MKIERITAEPAIDISGAGQSTVFALRPTHTERYAIGESLRRKCPRTSHADWKLPDDRSDPVSLIKKADEGRLAYLVPLRHGRMLESPFTFYRGAALNMAADLAKTPVTGIRVQACGDAHLLNFRGLATPERRLVFDIYDLDETLPAPWEWDMKRLATSFVLAARANGLGDDCAKDAARACARSYRKHIAKYSLMKALEVWYNRMDADDLIESVKQPNIRKRLEQHVTQEEQHSALEHDFPKLVHNVGEDFAIRDNPPTIFHTRDRGQEEFATRLRETFIQYRASMADDRAALLDRFEFKDIAIKVVGVGSVGTLCGVVLLMAGEADPLFLQVKEARASVLEEFAGRSVYLNHGQRVVNGHRLMQSASDIFLGWTVGKDGRHFYIRQLRDVRIKPTVETFSKAEMRIFAKWCGQSLARSHARSGDAAVISGYLGDSEVFDDATAAFSMSYADQTEKDHATFKRAAQNRRIKVLIARS